MLSVSEIKSICAQYNITPAKSRGQNFLIDQNIVNKIISAAELKKTDLILEVGPGLAVLTNELAQKAKKVYALELDKRLVEFLRAEFAQKEGKFNSPHPTLSSIEERGNKRKENVEIIEGDILKLVPDHERGFNINNLGLKDFGYKIVSNLPYNITSHFLKLFLGLTDRRPSEMIIMVQKEVGERLTAKPGGMSLLSLMVQFYSEPEILFKISKNSFWPAPKVDSVAVKLKLKENLPEINIKDFFRLARSGFSARRKQLHNNLAGPPRVDERTRVEAGGLGRKNAEIKDIFKKIGFDEKIRAQDLGVEDWVRLVKSLK